MKAESGYYERRDVNLIDYNSIRVDSIARILVQPFNFDGVIQTYKDFHDRKIIPIGVGSNIIFTKKEYSEDVVFLSTQLLNRISFNDGIITAESGTTMSKLAWYAVEHHMDKFWFMEDIPGSVGGGIIMNAGTHDGCMNDIVDTVTIYDAEKDTVENINNESIFVFRNSIFQEKRCAILKVSFKGEIGDYSDIVIKMTNQKANRYLKQPRDYPSAGSVFKTPIIDGESVNCWKLLKQSGLAGFSVGGAKVSEKHSGFIINYQNATGEDLVNLVDYCIEKVQQHTDVVLEPEWKFI